MNILINNCCWLDEARIIHSPNHDARPIGTVIDTIIIHSISLPPNIYGNHYVEDFFQNQLSLNADAYFPSISHLTVSAHFYIKRDGELVQFVDAFKRAWHAGVSSLNGRGRVNDFSIGIELEGNDVDAFTDAQYLVLQQTIAELKQSFPAITNARIVGHNEIAPGRKTDPGKGFDWSRIK